MIFFVMREVQNPFKKKKKNTNTRKTLKYEAKEKRRIQGKINNNNEHLWFYILYK